MIERELDPNDQSMITRMRKIPIFDKLNDRQLKVVATLAKIRKYEKGEFVMRQDDFDQWVYFLISGELEILKNEVEVCCIRRMGDVFGEMGVIDGSPRSASVRVLKPCLCLCVDGAFIDRLEGDDQTMAKAVFYRVFSEILAVRLRNTSERLSELEKTLGKTTQCPYLVT